VKQLERGEIVTLLIIGGFILSTVITLITSTALQSKKNITNTQAQIATPRDDNISPGGECSTKSEWKIKCNNTQGPCDKNAGVGIPYRCVNNAWIATNPLGECNISCKVETQSPPTAKNLRYTNTSG